MVNVDREKFLALTLALSSAPVLACASTTSSPSSAPATTAPPAPVASQPPPSTTPPPPATSPEQPPAEASASNCSSWAPWGECVAQGNETPPFFECAQTQNDPTVEGCTKWISNQPYKGCRTFDARGNCSS